VLTAFQRAEALRRRAAGETLTEIAKSFNVSHTTIARLGGAITTQSGERELAETTQTLFLAQ
jgi:hypothetical protein